MRSVRIESLNHVEKGRKCHDNTLRLPPIIAEPFLLSAARLQEDNLRARHGRRSVCIGRPGKDKRSAWERREWRSTNLGVIRRLSVSRRRRAILQIIRWGGYVNVSIFRPQSSSFPSASTISRVATPAATRIIAGRNGPTGVSS